MNASPGAQRRLAALVVIVFFVLGARGQAAAEDVDAIVSRGIELRKKGKDREALAEFERARAIQETPRVTAQIGLAEFALGLWLPAEEHLTKALKQEDDAWIKRNRKILGDALTEVSSRLGTVEVWGDPAGAEVIVNGKNAGTLPAPPHVRVVAGTCSLLVRAPGYEEASRSLRVKAGEHVRENVQLVRVLAPLPPLATAPGATAPGARPDQPRPAPAAEPAATAVAPAPAAGGARQDSQDGLWRRWWFWTALGAVVVAGAATAFILTRPEGGLRCPSGVECPP